MPDPDPRQMRQPGLGSGSGIAFVREGIVALATAVARTKEMPDPSGDRPTFATKPDLTFQHLDALTPP